MSLMTKDLIRAFDPTTLARDAGVELDKWQRDLLNSASKRILILASRQVGKTEVCLWRCIWQAVFDPGLIVIASPSLNQSSEFFRRFVQRYKALDDVPEIESESALRATLSNNAIIRCFPGTEKSVRGFSSVKLCFIDEAARVPDDLYVALKPQLGVTSGVLIMCSTPNGKQGQFYETWENGEGWTRIKIGADQCPRLSKEFLAEQLRELGPLKYRQDSASSSSTTT